MFLQTIFVFFKLLENLAYVLKAPIFKISFSLFPHFSLPCSSLVATHILFFFFILSCHQLLLKEKKKEKSFYFSFPLNPISHLPTPSLPLTATVPCAAAVSAFRQDHWRPLRLTLYSLFETLVSDWSICFLDGIGQKAWSGRPWEEEEEGRKGLFPPCYLCLMLFFMSASIRVRRMHCILGFRILTLCCYYYY